MCRASSTWPALACASPGSAFKPIVYSSAFRRARRRPATFFVDSVTQFGADRATSYMPTNADIKDHGPLLAVDALRYSLNVPSVMMQYLVGVNETAQFAESMGIASEQVHPGPGSGPVPGPGIGAGQPDQHDRRLRRLRRSRASCIRPPPSWRSATGTIGSSTRLKEDGPEADTADDPGRGVPDALDPGGQHQPRVQRAVGLARRAARPERRSAATRASRPGPPTTSATCPASATCRAAW